MAWRSNARLCSHPERSVAQVAVLVLSQSDRSSHGTADLLPTGLHISRRYGTPFHRAPRTEDGRPCTGRSPGSRLERPIPAFPSARGAPSVACRGGLAAHSCGGSHGLDPTQIRPCSLFIQCDADGRALRTGTSPSVIGGRVESRHAGRGTWPQTKTKDASGCQQATLPPQGKGFCGGCVALGTAR